MSTIHGVTAYGTIASPCITAVSSSMHYLPLRSAATRLSLACITYSASHQGQFERSYSFGLVKAMIGPFALYKTEESAHSIAFFDFTSLAKHAL